MAGFLGVVASLRHAWHRPTAGVSLGTKSHRRSSKRGMLRTSSVGVLRRCKSSSDETVRRSTSALDLHGAPWYDTPPDAKASLWHHVDLHVKTWLDEPTGLYRYVNEIPLGALQKFEVQTRLIGNVIREDSKGSKKLRAFGRPVPFNYGCFPQTFRDPKEFDEVFGAPGDDDPLDVLDLTHAVAGVGEVICCRVLGAVCLIDEGEADWKIIVVNTEAKSPLAAARSVEEVERIAPGRIDEALKWMDDFKQSGGKSNATLHAKIHDANRAIRIIEQDHRAWQRIATEVDSSGCAQGHWIHSPEQKKLPAQPQVLPFGWKAQLAVPGQRAVEKSSLTGTSVPEISSPMHSAHRSLTMRRQTSASSDGGDSSPGMPSSPLSSDCELGS